MTVNFYGQNIDLSRFEKSAGDLLQIQRNQNSLEATLNERIQNEFFTNVQNNSLDNDDINHERALITIDDRINRSNRIIGFKNNPEELRSFKIQDESKEFIEMLFDNNDINADLQLFSYLDISNIMEAFKKGLLNDHHLLLFSKDHLRKVKLEDLSQNNIKDFFPETIDPISNKNRFGSLNFGQILNAFNKNLFININLKDLISVSQLSRLMLNSESAYNTFAQKLKPVGVLATVEEKSKETNYSEKHKINCDILNVPYNATVKEIRQQYLKLVLQYHPDKNSAPDAIEKFNEINEAFKSLIG